MYVIPLVLSLIVFIGIFAPSSVTTGVTAYTQPEAATGKRFVLQGPDPRFPGGDPAWPSYARILTRALEAKGFVPDLSSPDLIVRVTYRVGDTQTFTRTTSTPITGITGTHTQTIVTPSADPMFPPTVTTITTPITGVVGTTESTSVSSSSLRTIQIEALSAASLAAGKPAVVWSTHARSRGTNDNLASVFPYMIAAMEDYFGANATEEISVSKTRNDPEVARLQQP